jgi:DNA-binding transcriptional LysR family regulator
MHRRCATVVHERSMTRWYTGEMNELLPLLPTLVTLARTGSVSQSARLLGVPRSTVSRRLTRIEGAVGVKVAERSHQRFVLTGAGRRLVDGAVEALAKLETVHEQARAIGGEVKGVLRVAMPAGVSGAFVGVFFAFLHARHPLIDIELTVTDRPALRLEEGFDLILVMGTPEPSGWLRRRLSETELLAVASPHYLAQAGTPTTIAMLRDHRLLGFAHPGSTAQWPRLRGGDFPVRPCLVTNDLTVLREAAVVGMGIALLPIHVALPELGAGTLVRVLPTLVGEATDLFALYLPERRASPVLKAVLAAIAEFAGEQRGGHAGEVMRKVTTKDRGERRRR